MEFQAPTPPYIRASVEAGIGRIVIDRPEKKNAITLAMWRHLTSLMQELEGRQDIRAVVLSGAGHDFSAGADIAEFQTERGDSQSARRYEDANSAAFRAFRKAPMPVIAAIDGVCFGGGFGLAASCDLRICTPRALFSVPAAKLGLAYPQDAMADIVAGLGPQLARYMTYTAGRIGADEALAAGFVLKLVPADELQATALHIAETIAKNAPLSVRASKAAITASLNPAEYAAADARALGDTTFDSADYAEGRAAFIERRQPRFQGR